MKSIIMQTCLYSAVSVTVSVAISAETAEVKARQEVNIL